MALDDNALDVLFRNARTKWEFTDQPVTDDELHALYDLVKLGPTSANCSPARFVFIRTAEGKDKLKPALSGGNIDKVMAAPVTVIVAQDPLFYQKLPTLFPHADAKAWFAGNPDLAEETAFRNSSLQGAYLMMAARAMGIDCGPMSGFDKAKVDRAFFAENGWKSNFLINLGHGVAEHPFPRLPKLAFEDAALFA
ncbi:MAG: malonic semialdehyde reductase [Acidocella sp. 20-57-95]|nr:MAG: malonic semialdehyde reductase [Acidocella sp. 20-57-95]OYV62722.1 MAG: malonic semialdehyde reductase [Acidocella sp. 21-58-7]HQT65386.1 malonic semialdehyde reductase [Acidocella sp.]HQU03273.1 malonic semialdehyde reductase [Acidocella sp.]